MPPTVAIIAPGAMGSGLAACLTARGVTVRTALAGRSAASAVRARLAGMHDADDAAIARCDIVLSVVPPGQAVALAERLLPALRTVRRKPVYVDCNAIAPVTAARIAALLAPSGVGFVDGGIIGPPPSPGSAATRLYISGPEAARAAMLADWGLAVPVLEGPIGFASAMKLSYAGLTKGFQALAAMMLLAATRAGTDVPLRAELATSQPQLLAWLTRQLPRMPDKAYRWVAEMEEIAAFTGTDPAAATAFAAAARLYERLAADYAASGPETAALLQFLG